MSLQAPSSGKHVDISERLNPLAVFQYAPVTPKLLATLRRLNAMLSTYSGVDKSMMLVQYASPLVALLITKASALRRQLEAGQHIKKAATSAAAGAASTRSIAIANSLKVLSSKISDARMLGRFFGLFPIIAWALSLEQKDGNSNATAQSKILKNVQRLQAWSMLVYYPLEHAYYLSAHGIINLAAPKRLKAILWACRAWAVYTFLQLYVQSAQAQALSSRMKFIAQKRAQIGQHDAKTAAEHMSEKDQSKVNTDEIVEQAGSAVEDAALVMNERECLQQGRTLVNGIMTNIAYAPMCVHWSLEKGLFKNEIWSSVFMTIAAVSGLHANWVATR